MPVSKLHFARCSHCGIDGRVVDQAIDGRCCDIGACLERVRSLPSPFDPNPRALEPAQNGFIWCEVCDAAVEAKGHECGSDGPAELRIRLDLATIVGRNAFGMYREERDRAEFAESLLCAMAFDHAAFLGERLFCVRSRRDRVTHGLGCVFCDAASRSRTRRPEGARPMTESLYPKHGTEVTPPERLCLSCGMRPVCLWSQCVDCDRAGLPLLARKP